MTADLLSRTQWKAGVSQRPAGSEGPCCRVAVQRPLPSPSPGNSFGHIFRTAGPFATKFSGRTEGPSLLQFHALKRTGRTGTGEYRSLPVGPAQSRFRPVCAGTGRVGAAGSGAKRRAAWAWCALKKSLRSQHGCAFQGRRNAGRTARAKRQSSPRKRWPPTPRAGSSGAAPIYVGSREPEQSAERRRRGAS